MLLAHEIQVGELFHAAGNFQKFFLPFLLQQIVQFGRIVKEILEDLLVAARDDENVANARADRLFHDVLQRRLVAMASDACRQTW